VNIGLVPDGGSTAFVAEQGGQARARRRWRCSASASPRPGAGVGPDQPRVRRRRLRGRGERSERLAAGPTRSYAGTKRQLNAWLYARMEEQLELEAQIQQEMAASGDFVEGVTAFIAEARPGLQGRLTRPCRDASPLADVNRCPRALAERSPGTPPVGRVFALAFAALLVARPRRTAPPTC
jgi:hypothetical protein